MNSYKKLFENNRNWVNRKLNEDPQYFEKLSIGQEPKFLWIGCSDSRVQATDITGVQPGEMFVHRNVANLVVNNDINLLSVVQYAVEVLKVEHIIICGHYGCGGVKAAMGDQDLGLINTWLLNIKDVFRLHGDELARITDEDQKFKKAVELNVIEQVYNLCKTSIIQKAWNAGMKVQVHGWVYDIRDGIIKDLDVDEQNLLGKHKEIFRLKPVTILN
jgi:carbonic anhydrase